VESSFSLGKEKEKSDTSPLKKRRGVKKNDLGKKKKKKKKEIIKQDCPF